MGRSAWGGATSTVPTSVPLPTGTGCPPTIRTGWTPQDAGVTAIAAVAGLLTDLGYAERPPATVLAATGDAAWLCAAVVDHLDLLRARYAAETAGMGAIF